MLVTFLDGLRRVVALTPGADLHGANLSGANLDGANLRRANLRGTNTPAQDPRRAGTGFKKAKELPLP